MAFDRELLDLMPHTVAHQPVSSYDEEGKPTLGASTNYSARVTHKVVRVPSRVSGQDVLSKTVVWIGGVIDGLTIDDRLTLPSAFMPADGYPEIVNWETPADEDGSYYMKIYLV